MRERSEGSLASLRRLNRRRVINALRKHGMVSRAEIARRTGLSRSTVSSLVAELQSDGLVVEREEQGAAHGEQGGRPPILLSFDASAGAALGIDFGHSHLRVAVADLSSTILAERAAPLDTDHAAHEGLDVALDLIEEVLGEAGVDRSRVIGAGLGLPGPIDQADGVIGSSAILPGWVGVAAGGGAAPPPRTSRSTSTTTPTSARWRSSPTARAAARPTSSTSRSPRASAPG